MTRVTGYQKPESTFDPEDWEPITVGPTWAVNEDGSAYVLPEHTLGWELARFAAKWLRLPGEGEDSFRPFTLTDEQLRFALWFYAIDKTGRFIYRRALLQRLKGWGKDPFAAVLAIFEAVGNCRFSHFDERGEVVGRPVKNAYIQIAAVSVTQTRNTSDMFRSLLTPEAIDYFAFSLGMEVQYAKGGLVQIWCVTSSPLALEGKRPSFMILNETQNWVAANKGDAMYGVMKGNLIKHADQCHMLVIANAPIPGRDSVSEKLIEGYENTLIGKADDRDLLYDSLEAPANAPVSSREVIEQIIEVVRGDSVWLDPVTVAGDFFDSMIPVSESRRKWFNQVVADSDSVYSKEQIKAAEQPGEELHPGDEIVLGFDGGRTDDATALIAIRIRDKVAIPIRIWERPRGTEDWKINPDLVESAVHDTFSRYRVRAFFADVNLWESYIASWSADYGDQLAVRASADSWIAWDMRGVKKATIAHERLVHALQNAQLHHNGDGLLVQHIMNARKRYNVHGMSFGKESRESLKKVDGYAALMLAYEALNVYLDKGRKPEKPQRTGRVAFY